MTVKELIQELGKCNPDAEVQVGQGSLDQATVNSLIAHCGLGVLQMAFKSPHFVFPDGTITFGLPMVTARVVHQLQERVVTII